MDTKKTKKTENGNINETITAKTLMINSQTGERPVTEEDIRILENLYAGYEACKESSNNLGIVVEDLVEKLGCTGKDVQIYDLQYIVEARRCIRAMIEAFEGLTPDFEIITVKL